MAGAPAGVAFDRTADADLIVRLSGELEHDTVPELTQTIIDHLGPDSRRVRIDLTGVAFCDSSGLSMFVRLQHEADRNGAELNFYNPSSILRATFAVCGLNEHLRIQSETVD